MVKLGINIDHIATLRQQRHTAYPDPIAAALSAETNGADFITMHLREDRRHIQDADVYALRSLLHTRMNLECSSSQKMLRIACDIKPNDICLVPENRSELTTEGGLDIVKNFSDISITVAELVSLGIRVSLFVDPDPVQIEAASQTQAQCIELHTGAYSLAKDMAVIEMEHDRLRKAIKCGLVFGFSVNAGHGLNFDNVGPVAALDGIDELNIGHAIVSRAVFDGWNTAVKTMKKLIINARMQNKPSTANR